MKLTYAQKVFLKFVAISQLYVALAVLAVVAYGAVTKLPWQTSWMFVLVMFLVDEAVAAYYMAKLHRQITAVVSYHDNDEPKE